MTTTLQLVLELRMRGDMPPILRMFSWCGAGVFKQGDNVFLIPLIKPTRCTNFSNLFLE